jgi:hypothetical protein
VGQKHHTVCASRCYLDESPGGWTSTLQSRVDRNRRKMDVGAQILGYVGILAVAENERARNPIGGSGGSGDEKSGITPSPCQGERGMPEQSEDMPQKLLDTPVP